MAMFRSLVFFFLLSCFSFTFANHLNQFLQQSDDATSDYPSISSDEDVSQLSVRIPKCPAKEHYEWCTAHCQKNCTNWNKPVICPKICVPGCVCNKGFVRGPEGKCIAESQCPVPHAEEFYESWDGIPKCPAKEHYEWCTAHCQKNCTNWDKPVICPKICVPGCVCNKGFVRGPEGKCIAESQCPVPHAEEFYESWDDSIVEECPERQHYSQCGAVPICQKNCLNYDKTFPCPQICHPGCVCEDEFVKGPDGNCIPPTQCPKSNEMESVQDQFPIPIICKRDEIFSVCASSCPDDCDNYKDTGRKCNLICLPGCTCKKGTVRGPNGKCIKPAECPRDKKPEDCTDYEYYDSCGTSCPDDCNNYSHPNRPCDKRCVIGCFCKPGYVRGPKGDCIFPFDCPNQQNGLPFNLLPNQQQRHAADPLRQFWDDEEPPLTENYNEESSVKYMPLESQAGRQFWNDEEPPLTENYNEELSVKYMPLESQARRHFLDDAEPQKEAHNEESTLKHMPPDSEGTASSSEADEPVLRWSPPRRNRQIYASGCPNESVCVAECVKEGRRYGICIGPRNRNCVCF